MKARAVIVGGGVLGLALAYKLAKRGWNDIVVCEKSHINAGASARCGGGIRVQWSTRRNIEIMLEAQHAFETFASRLGQNIWFRQGGYLFLAKSDAHVAALETNIRKQNENGVKTRLITRSEIKDRVPMINLDGIKAGAFNPTDGVLFPFPVLWGYANACRDLGVTIQDHTEVTGIETTNGRVTKVTTTAGEIETPMVINAAGAWSPQIGAMVGVELPNKPEKHEAIVTEPLRPFLNPNLVPMDSGMYLSQTMRGELYACVGHKFEEANYTASFSFVRKVSRLMTDLIPRLGDVKLLRHWAGFYDTTPDTNPILGPVKEVEGFIQFHGFMGHGFMMAPAVARIMADYLANDKSHWLIEDCNLARFETGGLEAETMIIG